MMMIVAGFLLAGASVSLWGCGGGDTTAAPSPGPAPDYDRSTIQKVWNNHFDAFGGFDLPAIMKDYDESSVIATFNDECFVSQTDNVGYKTYKGVKSIEGFFTALFLQLGRSMDNLNNIGPKGDVAEGKGAPVVTEAEGGSVYNGNVFLTWRTVNTLEQEITYATDSFSFKIKDGEYFIDYQTIVTTEPNTNCSTAPGQGDLKGPEAMYDAWDNHVAAFVSKNMTGIVEDYDEHSIVQLYDNRNLKYDEFVGVERITKFFEDLFEGIRNGADGSDEGLKVGLLEIDPTHSSVILAWQSFGYPKATDSFIFNGNKIARQNVVVTTKTPTQRVMV